MGGGGGGIDPVHLEAQHGKAEQGLHHAEQDHQRQLWQQRLQGLLGQTDAALEADGQQQKEGESVVEGGRQLELGAYQTGQQTKQKEENNNVQHDGSQGSSDNGCMLEPAMFR